jgi:hypothetical protein
MPRSRTDTSALAWPWAVRRAPPCMARLATARATHRHGPSGGRCFDGSLLRLAWPMPILRWFPEHSASTGCRLSASLSDNHTYDWLVPLVPGEIFAGYSLVHCASPEGV